MSNKEIYKKLLQMKLCLIVTEASRYREVNILKECEV